ncbi:MAG: TolC family protein [Vicinamibacterales bacterium]
MNAAQHVGRGFSRATLLVALTLLPALAHAQAPLPLTLEQALAKGKATAPRLLENQAREAAAEATRDSRATLGRPTMSASSGYVRTNHVPEYSIPQSDGSTRVLFPDLPNNVRVRTELLWPLWSGGRVDALVTSAEAEVRATQAEFKVAEADLTMEITVAYWTLVTSRELVKVIDQSLKRTDAWVSEVQARLDTGLISPHEVLTAKARRARDQVQRIQAANAAAAAERELARLIGMPGQRVEPVSPVEKAWVGLAALTSKTPGDVVALARESRAERTAFTERQSAFRSSAQAAMAALRPRVDALAALEPARPNSRFVPRQDKWHTSWDLGLTVSWSFWDSGRARADRAAAEAQARVLDHRLADFDARVSVDVQERLDEVEAGWAAIAAAQEAVVASEEAHRVLRERYAAGVATSTEVLDAGVALLEAELERTRIQASLRISEARLRRAVGVN